jgi:hypothetical protein
VRFSHPVDGPKSFPNYNIYGEKCQNVAWRALVLRGGADDAKNATSRKSEAAFPLLLPIVPGLRALGRRERFPKSVRAVMEKTFP